MESKRSTCIVCKTKRAQHKMKQFRSHWACLKCLSPEETRPQDPVIKILNLYAGLGGNRRYWPASFQVTAIEFNPKIAAEYKKLYPGDVVIVSCAHNYLLKNYYNFDIIWSSPPCQSHSRMNFTFGERKRRYVDMSLYQQILLLTNFFKGRYVVENVNPYYDCLIEPNYKIGRHCFWSNFEINQNVKAPEFKGDFIKSKSAQDRRDLMEWLNIFVEKPLYSSGENHCQVFRNCVHPVIGQSILNDAIKSL